MEQVGSGARQKRKDAKPFYVNITVIRNYDFTWKDGERCMPTQSEIAQIRKSSVLGQYKKRVEFYRNMSEKMVMEKLEGTFPYLRNKSYACKVFTSRPAGCISTSSIWDGKTIKRNTQGNSALYILEDEAEAEAIETSQQFCSNETATEGPKLRSADPLLCHGSSLPDSPPPDTIESRLFQNTTPPSRSRAMPTSKISEVYDSAGFSSDILTTNGNSVLDIDFSLEDLLPYNNIPDDVKFDFTDGPEKVPAEIPGCEDYVMADNNDQTGTTQIREFQLSLRGSLFNSTEMSDSSADNHTTTSGISGLDQYLSFDDLSPHEDKHFPISVEREKVPLQMPQESPHETNDAANSSDDGFSVDPKRVPLQGGTLCCFSSSALPGNVQSALAIYENLGTVKLKRCGEDSLLGRKIPPSKAPGVVRVLLRQADGTELGETEIEYYNERKEVLQRITNDPMLQADFFQYHSEKLRDRNTTTANSAEAQNSGICGSTEPVQMLCALVYAAAEIGSQQFIEMIFNSSAGRVVYDRYKDTSALPEAIARENGHEKTATFLEEITGRFSEEASEAQNYPQTIDWSELVRAAEEAEEAQKQSGLSTGEERNHLENNVVKDIGYLGDIDTSSNESYESGSSDSEDNIPRATSKEMNYLADELSEIALVHEDQEFGIKKAAVSQSLMYFCKTGHFNREQVNATVPNKVALPILEEWQLSLFRDGFIRPEASGLKHLRSLNRCDTSFFLGPEQESIPCHIITEYGKWCLLFRYIKYSSLQSRTFATDGEQFVEQVNQETQAVMMEASFGCAEDLLRIQSKRELVTTSDNPELPVKWNSTQGSTKHSTSSDLWVLTCLYRPARNILFVYVADNSDVLPQKAYFDDDRYELSTQYWQWQRYTSSLFDVRSKLQEMRKLSEQMRPEFGPTPLPTYGAKMLPQVQGKYELRQPECCPTWLYTIMHQCWVYAPAERPPFIAIFDGISSRTQGAHLAATWLSQYNQGEYLSLKKCQSEDPCFVNDKTNHPTTNVNVTDYRSARKEKFYEEHLHEDDESNVVRTLSICSPGYEQMSQKQRTGSHDSVARILSVSRWLRNGYSEGLEEGMSVTSLNLIIKKNSQNLYGVLMKSLGKGVSKSTSSITLPSSYLPEDWGIVLGKGLANGKSLTAFTLTIDGVYRYLGGDWGKGLARDHVCDRRVSQFN